MIKKNESISIGWCDNGNTDGKFVEGLATILMNSKETGVTFTSFIRVEGNQIGRQRQKLFDCWADQVNTDWLLWIDSDVCLTISAFKKLLNFADKDLIPVITGTYFVSKELDGSLMVPYPVLFNNVESEKFQVSYIHPLPENELIKCDSAGMGLVLMHKSIIPKLREMYPNQSVFAEQEGLEDLYISEDVSFFRKLKNAGIPLHAHTGAIVTHVKRFQLNADYYKLYWNNKV
jgi:hypothetical protein